MLLPQHPQPPNHPLIRHGALYTENRNSGEEPRVQIKGHLSREGKYVLPPPLPLSRGPHRSGAADSRTVVATPIEYNGSTRREGQRTYERWYLRDNMHGQARAAGRTPSERVEIQSHGFLDSWRMNCREVADNIRVGWKR